PAGLIRVVVGGLAGVDLAEVAAPGALAAADEEGRLAVLPALEDVGAAGLLAHRVQVLVFHEVLQLPVLGAHLGHGLDPRGLALDGGLRVAHLQAQQLATCGWVAHRTGSSARSAAACTSGTTISGVISWPSSRLIVVTP